MSAAELSEANMTARFSATLIVIAALASGVVAAAAGPCTKQIAAFEQAVRVSGKNPNAGPIARESLAAKLGRQPTPESVRRAKQRARETFQDALVRARALDVRGNRAECMRALARAKDLFDLQ
jgi:uncharacterized iron-regulated membrane protein